jgi:glycogen debranching enzyme
MEALGIDPPGRPSGALGEIVDSGAVQALDVLRGSASPQGFVASAALPHYAVLWARDVAFSAMGADVSGDPVLVESVRTSLVSLARTQSRNGQIANDYWPGRKYWDFHESGSTDATCLFVVATAQHLAAHPDAALRARLWPHLRRAVSWLGAQDANQFSLIDSPMGGDWMDSTLQRSGKLLYVNVLYQRALRGMAELAADPAQARRYGAHAELVRRKLNTFFWPQTDDDYGTMLEGTRFPRGADVTFPHPVGKAAHAAAARADRSFYLSHVEGQRRVDECDVLGNVLAVLFGVADAARAQRIMSHLRQSDAVLPYPVRTYIEPLQPGDRWGMLKTDLDQVQDPRWRNAPHRYHNAGVWPFIGGLYVVALERVGMHRDAVAAMQRLAAANRLGENGAEWGFHEWIDSATGAPGGAPRQTWSAGTYLLAYHALRGEEVHL